MTTTRMARSTHTGCAWPTLSGTAGDLTTLLDAVLVNGSTTVAISSITRSGSTATVTTSSAHGFTATDPESARRALIAGANEAEYNGEFTVTVTDGTHFTYQVTGTPATPATGSITVKRPPLGWAIAYTGTNKRVYRAPSGNRHYLRINDDGTGAATYARCRFYATMSDVDTGTEPTPTDAQVSGGLYCHKSNAASAATRGWIIIGHETFFHVYIDNANAAVTDCSQMCLFGEVPSFRSGDAYNTFISAADITASSQSNKTPGISALNSTIAGHFFMRSYTQLGTSTANVGKTTMQSSGSAIGNAGFTFPTPMDGGVHLAPLYLHETTAGIRATIPGLWNPLHNRGPANGDTWTGIGTLAGKTFLAINVTSVVGNTNGQCVIDTTTSW